MSVIEPMIKANKAIIYSVFIIGSQKLGKIYKYCDYYPIVMLDKIKELIKRQKAEPVKGIPLHVAITMHGVKKWAGLNNVRLEEAFKKSFELLPQLFEEQIKSNIRIVTYYLLPEVGLTSEEVTYLMFQIKDLFEKLAMNKILDENQFKVSVLGKWYDLAGEAVEPIKKVIAATKDYDNFFVNFCINYDGQTEIVDAVKLIARKVVANKLEIDHVDKETIKENLASSYFLPPALIIKNGSRKGASGLLLWDSIYSEYFFTDKNWPAFKPEDFKKAIEYYKKKKGAE